MRGVITGWDILTHPVVTIRCFGWGVFFRAVVAGNHHTFLSLLHDAHAFVAGPAEPPPVEAGISLELRAKQVYTTLAGQFGDVPLVRDFFATLAQQEQQHADLLKLCRLAVRRSRWQTGRLANGADLNAVERRFDEFEMSAAAAALVDDALRIVVAVESSEINETFAAIVAATDAGFVRRVRAFRAAQQAHVTFLCRRIVEFQPAFAEACQVLQARYLAG